MSGTQIHEMRNAVVIDRSGAQILGYLKTHPDTTSYQIFSDLNHSIMNTHERLRDFETDGLVSVRYENRENYSAQGDALITKFSITPKGEFALHKATIEEKISSAGNLYELTEVLRSALTDTDSKRVDNIFRSE